MTLSTSEINAAYQSLPPTAREFIEHSDDWKTISDVLVEKYNNNPELGRDAFGAIGDLTAGLAVDLLLAGTPTGWTAKLIYGAIAGKFGDAAGKAAWDILTSKEWRDFTDPAKNMDWEKLVNPEGYDFCNNGTHLLPGICDKSNTNYLLARNLLRRDPLAIDLDGDGIETVGVNAGVLFDHDADAIKTGTGWLKADDAFVVLDRDGNGTIDSGRELFGVDTIVGTEPLTGRAIYAVDAFDALKSIDSNGDKLFNSADAQYGNLRLWRDLNQDGISQATELQGLAEAAITSINLTTQKATKTLPGGNTQILTAAVAGLGESAAVALELAHNPFYRQFPDRLDTTSVASLPDMAGSGMVRDLQEAATLSTSLASQLAALQNGYRDRQQFDTELDTLLDAWAATSTLKTSAQNAVLYKTSVQIAKVSRGGTPANGTWKHAA